MKVLVAMKDIGNCGGYHNAWPCGIPACSKCGKTVRTVWGTMEWHKANDPIDGYCQCQDNHFKALVEAAKKQLEEPPNAK